MRSSSVPGAGGTFDTGWVFERRFENHISRALVLVEEANRDGKLLRSFAGPAWDGDRLTTTTRYPFQNPKDTRWLASAVTQTLWLQPASRPPVRAIVGRRDPERGSVGRTLVDDADGLHQGVSVSPNGDLASLPRPALRALEKGVGAPRPIEESLVASRPGRKAPGFWRWYSAGRSQEGLCAQ